MEETFFLKICKGSIIINQTEFWNGILNNRDMFVEQITFVPQPARAQKSKTFVLAKKSCHLLLIPSPFACMSIFFFCSARQFVNKICFFSTILSVVKCQKLYVLKHVQTAVLHLMQNPDYFRNIYNHIKQKPFQPFTCTLLWRSDVIDWQYLILLNRQKLFKYRFSWYLSIVRKKFWAYVILYKEIKLIFLKYTVQCIDGVWEKIVKWKV